MLTQARPTHTRESPAEPKRKPREQTGQRRAGSSCVHLNRCALSHPCWATAPGDMRGCVQARAGRRKVGLGGPLLCTEEAELPGPKPTSWQGTPIPFTELNSLDNKIKCITEQSDSKPEAEKSRFFFS